MRRTFSLVLLCLALFAYPARADLLFKQVRVDRGETKSGPALVERYAFVNAGPNAIDVLDAKTSCGCLKPRFSAKHYEPGEEGWIELEVNTLSQPAGPNAWRVDLTYRDGGEEKQGGLVLCASLVADIRVEPSALNIFTDKQATHEIVVTDFRAKAFNVTAVDASAPYLKPKLTEPARDAQGHSVRIIQLEVAADCPEGKHEAVVALHTDDPAYRELKVPVTVVKHARQRLSVSPDRVDFSGPPFPSRIVLLRDADNQGVVIDGAKSDDPAITCRWASGPGAMATLKLQVDPEQLHGRSLQTTVHVHVKEPVAHDLSLPVEIRSADAKLKPDNR